MFSGPEGTYQLLATAAVGFVCCQVVFFVFSTISQISSFLTFPPFCSFKYTTNAVYIFDIVKLSLCIQSLYSQYPWLAVRGSCAFTLFRILRLVCLHSFPYFASPCRDHRECRTPHLKDAVGDVGGVCFCRTWLCNDQGRWPRQSKHFVSFIK